MFGFRRKNAWLVCAVVVGACVWLWAQGDAPHIFRSPDGAAEVHVAFRFAWKLEWEKLRIRLYEVKEGRRTLLEEQNGWFRTYNASSEDRANGFADYFKVDWDNDGAVEVIETFNGQVFRFHPRPEPHGR